MNEAISAIFHEDQVRIWAGEIIEALALAGVLSVNTYDDKVSAYCAVDRELRSIGQSVASVAPPLSDPRVALDSFDMLIAEARTEAAKAMRKFPQPNYVISKVAEEAGEVVKAAIHAAEGRETMENLRVEMTQVIAMLYRLWIEGDQVHGLPPVAAALEAAKGAGECS